MKEPVRGWCEVKPVSEGTLVFISDTDVMVNFPECKGWSGLVSEIEKVRPVTVGDKVKLVFCLLNTVIV